MSSVGDENSGPGVLLKEAGDRESPRVPSSTALKQSNKANIMSPLHFPIKESKAEISASMDATVMKEKTDQQVSLEQHGADEDDIISFKPPDTHSVVDDDIDPFKTRNQLLNSPLNNGTENQIPPVFQNAENDGNLERDSSSDYGVQDHQVISTEVASPAQECVSGANEKDDCNQFKQQKTESEDPVKNDLDKNVGDSLPSTGLKESMDAPLNKAEDLVPGNVLTGDTFMDPTTSNENAPGNFDNPKSEEIDPFMTKNQLPNSPKNTGHSSAPVKICTENGQSDKTLEESANAHSDLLKPNTHLLNSPKTFLPLLEFDPLQSPKQLGNSPGKSSNYSSHISVGVTDTAAEQSNLDGTATQATKSDDITEEMDPFKPSMQLANSPEQVKNIEAVDFSETPLAVSQSGKDDMQKQTVNSEKVKDILKEDNIHNPRQPSVSPVKAKESTETDALSLKTQLVNSPYKGAECEGIDQEPEINLVNTPVKKENLEFDENYPFRPNAQLANSPDKTENESMEVSKSPRTENSNHEIEAFKPKTQLANSPVSKQNASEEFEMEETDPFKPKMHLANSPVGGDHNEEIDPFKPRMQLSNSPRFENTDQEIEAFKPKTQLANSPVTTQNANEEIDPFKPKSQLVSNTPERDVCDKNASIVESSICLAVEPEKIKVDVPTPSQSSEVKSSTEPEKNLEADVMFLNSLEALEEKGQSDTISNPLFLAKGDDFGFDDNMFISGIQAFSDPGALDLLEQFGGGAGAVKETDLRKCSLYVKFDPLVKPTLPKTPEKMPAPTRAAPRKPAGRTQEPLNISQMNTSQMNASVSEESICLFGTPPRVARRRSVLGQRRMNMSAVSQTITEEEHAKPVDMLLTIGGESDQNNLFLNDPSRQQTQSATLVDFEEGAKYTEAEHQKLLQALSMQYEEQILAKERKFASQLEEKADAMKTLQANIIAITEENGKLSNSLGRMTACVSEYEKTLNTLMGAKEKLTTDFEDMKSERDQAFNDVQALENSFYEFHQRYEKLKQTLEGYRKNEETLKNYVTSCKEKMKGAEDTMAKVKAKAEEKIKEVMSAMEKKGADVARLEAELKRNKVHIQSLENMLEQKSKENKELTELCDTLIAQVGGGK